MPGAAGPAVPIPETAPASLAEALAALQGQLPRVAKEHKAKVETKEGRGYSYDYADLTDVSAVILPLLSALGLSFIARPTMFGDRFVLHYELLHISQDLRDGFYPLPTSGSPQDIGKAITYARRYALCAVTGLAPGGDDDDAQSAEAAHHEARKQPRNEDQELPEDKPGTSSLAQQQAIAIELAAKGIGTREDKLAYCGIVTGRDIASSKELSYNEAAAVLKAARELEAVNA